MNSKEPKLTPREFQVVTALANSKTWDQIVHETGTSRNTVAKQRRTAMERYGVSTFYDLLIALGWLHIPEAQ